MGGILTTEVNLLILTYQSAALRKPEWPDCAKYFSMYLLVFMHVHNFPFK